MTTSRLNAILLFLFLVAIAVCVLTDCGPQQYIAERSVKVKVWQDPCKIEVLADDEVRCTVSHPSKACQFGVTGEVPSE